VRWLNDCVVYKSRKVRYQGAAARIHLPGAAHIALVVAATWRGPIRSADSFDRTKPDPATLSLQVMNVDVLIDNQHARVRVLQIFDNHVAQQLEGKYLFALPPQSSISDFAVWDADTRIPRDDGKNAAPMRFTVKSNNSKSIRVCSNRMTSTRAPRPSQPRSFRYRPTHQACRAGIHRDAARRESYFAFHFSAEGVFRGCARVEEFNLHVHILSDYPIAPLPQSGNYSLKVTKSDAHEFEASYQARALQLQEDFSFDYRIEAPRARFRLSRIVRLNRSLLTTSGIRRSRGNPRRLF